MRRLLLAMALLLACGDEDRSVWTGDAGAGSSSGGSGGSTGCEAVYYCLLDDCQEAWEAAQDGVSDWPECADNCRGEADDVGDQSRAMDAFNRCMRYHECGGC